MKLGTMDIGVEKIPQDSIVDVLGKLLFVIFYEITTFKRQERVAKYRITILCFQSIFRTEQTTDITRKLCTIPDKILQEQEYLSYIRYLILIFLAHSLYATSHKNAQWLLHQKTVMNPRITLIDFCLLIKT